MTTDVTARLRVDDAGATTTLGRYRDAWRSLGGAEKQAATEGMGFFKQAAASALAFNAGNIVSQVRATAGSFVDAAAASAETRRSMAATSMVLEHVPWSQATERAKENAREIREIGMASGIATTELNAAYNALLEGTSGGADGIKLAKKELEESARIADAFGLSVEGVSREISLMHEGTIRTRGQLFQLLHSTGIFGRNVHGIAEGWAKMTDADRARAMSIGLSQVDAKLAQLPPSYKRVVGQIEHQFEGMKRDLGEPLVEALRPALQDIVPRLATMRESLHHIAQTMGPEIAHWVREAAALVERALGYIDKHGLEIKDAIVSAFDHAREVIEWIIAHKTELAALLGGAKLSGMVGGALPQVAGLLGSQAGGGLLGAATKLGSGVGISAVAAGAGEGTAMFASTAAGLGALAAAAAAAAVALYAVDKAYQARKEAVSAQGGAKGNIEQLASQGDVQHVQALISQMRQFDQEAEKTRGAFGSLMAHIDSTTETSLGMSKKDFDEWAQNVIAHSAQVDSVTKQLEQQAGTLEAPVAADQVVAAYNQAVKLQNDAAMVYAAQMLVQSGVTAETLKESGVEIAGGLDQFTGLFANASGDLKNMLAGFLGQQVGATAKPPTIAMSGGQTFNLRQDFRDQDPDNVAIVFERDIGRAVQNRIASSTSTAFGG